VVRWFSQTILIVLYLTSVHSVVEARKRSPQDINSCVLAYEKFSDSFYQLAKSREIGPEFEAVFNDDSIDSPTRARKLYNIWISHLGRDLSPDVKRAWEATLPKNFPDRPKLSKLLGPAYFDKLRTILGPKLQLDERDFLNYAIYFHEAVHSLNHNTARVQGYLVTPGEIRNPSVRASYRFKDEVAAMTGEWQFLRSIPEAIRVRIAEQIAKDPDTPKYLVDLGPRMLRMTWPAQIGPDSMLIWARKAGSEYGTKAL